MSTAQTTTPPATLSRFDLLLAQYDTSYAFYIARLQGMGDDEYFWEPVAGCWNLRRRVQATPQALGSGEWVLDWVRPEPVPPPVTTIAWRVCHLLSIQQLRYEYLFGNKQRTFADVVYPGSVAEALVAVEASHQAWRQGLLTLSDGDLDVIGLSAYPWAWDPNQPFGTIFWWTNRELMHHAGEIGALRDLWAFRPLR